MPHFKLALIAALVGSALPALSAEFKPADDVLVRLNTTVTAGTMVRMRDPHPDNYALIPSTTVPGAAPGQLIGQTGGADLNFEKHKPVSTVVKAVMDLDVAVGKSFGLFARAAVWTDLTLGHQSAAYGNYANGYTPGAPLSDQGFAQDAKFDAARFRDAYVWGRFDAGSDVKAELRLGRQVQNWGVSQFFTGGVGAATNAQDLAAQLRPGGLPQEARVPVGMLSLSVMAGKAWGLDAYAPYEFRPSNVPGCGTFFDGASIVQPGCNMSGAVGAPIAGTPLATLASLTERTILASGYHLHRDPSGQAGDSGQYGLAVRYTAASIGTEFRAYAARSHNTTPNIFRVTIENVSGATLPAGLAGGLGRLTNPNGIRYSVLYPEGVRMFGASFSTTLSPAARVFGEVAYRPNQPLGMSPVDILTAALLRAPTSQLALQRNFLAVPAGGQFEAYDRYGVITANLGGNRVFPKVLGADRVVLAGEIGMAHVNGLPDPAVMRYGRSLAYGAAPYMLNGAMTACAETAPGLNGVPGKTCTLDGFISRNAWGLRGRVAATYGGAFFGAALTPSLTLAKDVEGYSYDGTFNEGRTTARLALRADWGLRFFGEIAYAYLGGGKYNVLSDRSNLSLVAGASF